jgi:hypothetical protein
MSKKYEQVVPSNNQCSLKGKCNSKNFTTTKYLNESFEVTCNAKKQRELIIHNKEGMIRQNECLPALF